MEKKDEDVQNSRYTSAVYQDLFAKFGEYPEVTDDLLEGTENFLCDMYGTARLSNVEDVHYVYFKRTMLWQS